MCITIRSCSAFLSFSAVQTPPPEQMLRQRYELGATFKCTNNRRLNYEWCRGEERRGGGDRGGDQCKGLRSHESGSAGSCVHVPQAACCCTLGKGRGSSLMHGTAKGKEHTRAQPNERKKKRRVQKISICCECRFIIFFQSKTTTNANNTVPFSYFPPIDQRP